MVNKRMKNTYAWKIFIMCCCISGAVAGMVVHCKGIFYAPAAASLGVSPTKFATYSTFGSLAGVFAMPLVTKMFNEKPLKRILLCYLGLFCASEVLMAFVTRMWQCYLIGIMQGLVSSFLTVYPIAYLLRNWFTRKRGMVTGAATMFAGLFSSIMNMVLSYSIELLGWRVTYAVAGISAFLLSSIPVFLFAVRSPSEIGLEPYGGYEDAKVKDEKNSINSCSKTLFLSMVPVFILTFSFYMATGYNQHLSNYAQTLGLSALFGASLISVCMIGNTISKLILGILNDRIGVYATSTTTVLTMMSAFFILMLQSTNSMLLYAAAIFLGQSTAFIVVQIPLLLSDQYPVQSDYEKCLSSVMMVGSLTSAINNIIINFLYSESGSYRLGHGLSGLMLLLCATMIIYLYKRKKRDKGDCSRSV